jgi:hypothetical protein
MMFPSGENEMGARTLAEDLPTHPGEGHTAENSTIVYEEEYNFTSVKRLEKGLVLASSDPSAREPEYAILLTLRKLAPVRFCPAKSRIFMEAVRP